MFDIVLISYDEPTADSTYAKLQEDFPYVKRVHGVVGIAAAHYEAAKLASTEMFYVIDGDNEPLSTFKFDTEVQPWDQGYTHIWPTKNIVNGSTYGYGGIKLFNTQLMTVDKPPTWIDFCSTRGLGIKCMNTPPASITHFDQTPFHTFRATAREVFKLATAQHHYETTLSLAELSTNTEYADVIARLSLWRTDDPNTEYQLEYNAGVCAAQTWYDQNIDPTLINNFTWLRDQWTSQSPNEYITH
jgi:hypothetical protein